MHIQYENNSMPSMELAPFECTDKTCKEIFLKLCPFIKKFRLEEIFEFWRNGQVFTRKSYELFYSLLCK